MSKKTTTALGLTSAIAFGLSFAAPLAAQSAPAEETASDAGLASETLSDGQAERAIRMLEAQLEQYPNDPALLINLGIAHAQSGNDGEARANFEAAMRSRDVVELETANGGTTDSRRLARRALSMLERGEFRPDPQTNNLTLRD